jgi:hypothetical protein
MSRQETKAALDSISGPIMTAKRLTWVGSGFQHTSRPGDAPHRRGGRYNDVL